MNMWYERVGRMDIPKLAETIADHWRGLKKFAAELALDIAHLPAKANRGITQNLAILESWVRAALLQLADTVELPAPRRRRRKIEAIAPERRERALSERRLGFRAIEPDAYELQRAAKTRFDISQFSGGRGSGPRRDPRPVLQKRLEAIEAVLAAPDLYARRVKQTLEARRKRPPVTHLKVTQRSALPDLLSLSPTSAIGRALWYNDSS